MMHQSILILKPFLFRNQIKNKKIIFLFESDGFSNKKIYYKKQNILLHFEIYKISSELSKNYESARISLFLSFISFNKPKSAKGL